MEIILVPRGGEEMVTEFGKMLRKIRIDKNEILMDMARKLEVSASFLSSVENGKKSVPTDWCDKISDIYRLNKEDSLILKEKAEESAKVLKVDLTDASLIKRKVALTFAREFSDMSDEQAQNIIAFIKNNK